MKELRRSKAVQEEYDGKSIDFQDIMIDYLTIDVEDIIDIDDTIENKIKIIVSSIDDVSKCIFLLYAKFGNQRTLANIYRCSQSYINDRLFMIKHIIEEDCWLSVDVLINKYKYKLKK